MYNKCRFTALPPQIVARNWESQVRLAFYTARSPQESHPNIVILMYTRPTHGALGLICTWRRPLRLKLHTINCHYCVYWVSCQYCSSNRYNYCLEFLHNSHRVRGICCRHMHHKAALLLTWAWLSGIQHSQRLTDPSSSIKTLTHCKVSCSWRAVGGTGLAGGIDIRTTRW